MQLNLQLFPLSVPEEESLMSRVPILVHLTSCRMYERPREGPLSATQPR